MSKLIQVNLISTSISDHSIFFSVSNDEKGIKQAIKTIKKHAPQRIVVEATGRLEMPFVIACAEANLPFVIANPIHIKHFAGAIGQRAKTDKLHAAYGRFSYSTKSVTFNVNYGKKQTSNITQTPSDDD